MRSIFLTPLIMIAFLGLSFISSPSAQAGFLIEPYLGYETGEKDDTDSKGLGYGARLGLTTLGFMYGVDYSLGKITSDNSASIPFNYNDLGLFVGYDFPLLPLRVWLNYFVSSKMDFKLSGTSVDNSGSGGTKLGIGFGFLPLVSINLEMIERKYDKIKTLGVEITSNSKIKTYMLSVSLPLP